MMIHYIIIVILILFINVNGNEQTGNSFPIEIREKTTNLFVIGIRFVGPSAFAPVENPNGAIRCQIFLKVTLPSLVNLMKYIPPRSSVNVVLINQTSILEPTCALVIDKARKALGTRLFFSSDIKNYHKQFKIDYDYLFYSRLDTDDAVHPRTLIAIHDEFLNSGMPLAVLSPYFGNLWYPTAGKDCGQMIYNTNLRRYPVLQTSAFHKKAFKRIMDFSKDDELVSYLSTYPSSQILPYHYEHLKPEIVFTNLKINRAIMDLNVTDCLLYFNVYEDGIPGIIYTQTGLQSSLVRRGWKNSSHLKWYDKYEENNHDNDPDVCNALKKFGINSDDVTELRQLIEKDHLRFSMDDLAAGPLHTNKTIW